MYKLITFDIYSAIMDIFGSGVAQIEELIGLDRAPAAAFFSSWRERQWNLLLLYNSIGRFAPYETLTKEALLWAADQHGLNLDTVLTQKLMAVWVSFSPWPEAAEAIASIRAKNYSVAMLSNGDRTMLTALGQAAGIRFDHIFPAEDAGCYKPCPAIYRLPLSLVSAGESYLHVAGSAFDVMGAVAAGTSCVWVNRKGEQPLGGGFAPQWQVKDLCELAALLP